MKKKQILFISITIMVLIVLGIALYIIFFAVNRTASSSEASEAAATELDTSSDDGNIGDDWISYDGIWYQPKSDLSTVLLIGVDKDTLAEIDDEGYRNDSQSDVLILCIIDDENKSYTALQINRDTVCDVSRLDAMGKNAGTIETQIAVAHTYGSGEEDSCELTVQAVSNLLYGMELKDYACLSIDGIPILNDAVGGVPVTIEDDFSSVEPDFVMGETIALHGAQAETFIRSRGEMAEPTNVNRMNRQSAYIESWISCAEKAIEQDNSFVLTTVLQLSDYLVSNLSVYDMSDLAEKLTTYENLGIQQIKGETAVVDGFMEFYPDEDSLRAQVVDLFYEQVSE